MASESKEVEVKGGERKEGRKGRKKGKEERER